MSRGLGRYTLNDMSLIKFLAGLLILATVVCGAVWVVLWLRQVPEAREAPVVVRQAADETVLRSVISVGEAQRRFVCEAGVCAAPRGDDVSASWEYSYVEREGESGETVRVLQRRSGAGEVQHITESTPLVEPRELFVSPEGERAAFFLDNVDEPREQLTEVWLFDGARSGGERGSGGIRLLAEKLYRPDVRTDLRWNAAGTHVMAVVDSGEREADEDRLELLVIGADERGVAARFGQVDWEELVGNFRTAVFDVAADGVRLAYTRKNFLRQTQLVVTEGAEHERTTVSGSIPFAAWLGSDVLYVVQDGSGFTVWRISGGVHRNVARQAGSFSAARLDAAGDYLVFARQTAPGVVRLGSVRLADSAGREEGTVAGVAGELRLEWVEQAEAAASEIAGVRTFSDEELTAFVSKHITAIAGTEKPVLRRIMTTSTPNTIYLDYGGADDAEERILLSVRDVVNPEWSIRARYEPVAGEWRRVRGGGLDDPEPAALYEWETGLGQWVLKQSLDPPAGGRK